MVDTRKAFYVAGFLSVRMCSPCGEWPLCFVDFFYCITVSGGVVIADCSAINAIYWNTF